jgi:hypothetical protein
LSADRRDGGALGTISTLGFVGLVVHFVLAAKLGIAYAIPTTLVGLIGGAIALRGPLGQALARRISGGGSELPPEQVLNELDELRGRLTELEERADFAERLLAKQKEMEPPGA